MIQFVLNGTKHTYDDQSVPFSEAMERQAQTCLNTIDWQRGLVANDDLAHGALFWVAHCRALAAEQHRPFRDVARENPFAEWDCDLLEVLSTMRRLDAEGNPIEPQIPGATTGSSPDTSDRPPPTTPSTEPAAATSDSSPTTSTSARGSGTASKRAKPKR